MAKAIVNKHIDSIQDVVLSKQFTSDEEMRKGELLICNDPNDPTIYIMDTEGNTKKIADDTDIWVKVNENSAAIEDLQENGVDSTIPQEIVVAGLDGQFGAGNYKNNDVIAAGTDIYTILQNMLCKELYPTNVKAIKASAEAKMNALTLALNASGTVEVGTLVKLTKGETNGSAIDTSKTKDSSITGMTYGYSWSNDNTKVSSDTSITKKCNTEVSDNTYSISATINSGFDADKEVYVKTIPSTQTGTGKAALTETQLGCVVEDENKITISAEGASYSYSADKIDKVFYCSNLGKTDASEYIDGVEASSGTTNKPTTSASAKVTGAYYYFLGYSDNTLYSQFDSDSIRNLTVKSGWIDSKNDTIIVGSTPMKSNGKSIVIACPDTYELATIENPPADLKPLFLTSGTGSDGTVSVKCGEINVSYHVYVYPITNNVQVDFKNVTLTKK
jgi:hypothetical protein